MTGLNEFGGCGGFMQFGALPEELSGGTWHLSTTTPVSVLASFPGLIIASSPNGLPESSSMPPSSKTLPLVPQCDPETSASPPKAANTNAKERLIATLLP